MASHRDYIPFHLQPKPRKPAHHTHNNDPWHFNRQAVINYTRDRHPAPRHNPHKLPSRHDAPPQFLSSELPPNYHALMFPSVNADGTLHSSPAQARLRQAPFPRTAPKELPIHKALYGTPIKVVPRVDYRSTRKWNEMLEQCARRRDFNAALEFARLMREVHVRMDERSLRALIELLPYEDLLRRGSEWKAAFAIDQARAPEPAAAIQAARFIPLQEVRRIVQTARPVEKSAAQLAAKARAAGEAAKAELASVPSSESLVEKVVRSEPEFFEADWIAKEREVRDKYARLTRDEPAQEAALKAECADELAREEAAFEQAALLKAEQKYEAMKARERTKRATRVKAIEYRIQEAEMQLQANEARQKSASEAIRLALLSAVLPQSVPQSEQAIFDEAVKAQKQAFAELELGADELVTRLPEEQARVAGELGSVRSLLVAIAELENLTRFRMTLDLWRFVLGRVAGLRSEFDREASTGEAAFLPRSEDWKDVFRAASQLYDARLTLVPAGRPMRSLSIPVLESLAQVVSTQPDFPPALRTTTSILLRLLTTDEGRAFRSPDVDERTLAKRPGFTPNKYLTKQDADVQLAPLKDRNAPIYAILEAATTIFNTASPSSAAVEAGKTDAHDHLLALRRIRATLGEPGLEWQVGYFETSKDQFGETFPPNSERFLEGKRMEQRLAALRAALDARIREANERRGGNAKEVEVRVQSAKERAWPAPAKVLVGGIAA